MAVGRSFRVYQKYIQGAPFSLIVENSRNTEEFLLFESGVVASLCKKIFFKFFNDLMFRYCVNVSFPYLWNL